MTVSGNTDGCTPNANNVKPENNTIEYMWYGPYINGTDFTAVYSVHVPIDVPEGNYVFEGYLEYYIGGEGPFTEEVTGHSVINVIKGLQISGLTGEANCSIEPDVTVILYNKTTGDKIAETTSDTNGNYTLTAPCSGGYNVTASKAGFKKNVSGVKITAKELVEKPADIPDAPDIVFKYLEYHIENVLAEDIGEITIPFDVPKSWIASENIDPVTVRLNRYYEDVWNPLPTEKVGEDDEYIYYSAETEGLSLFAIIGEKKREVEVPTSAMWVWAIVGVVLLIVVIPGVWHIKKKRK